MSKSYVATIVSAFVIGMLSGIFGVITFRHEIWPIAGHVKEMTLYVVSVVPIFLILFIWYMKIIESSKKVFGRSLGELINAILSFLLVTLILLFAVIIGIFFVVVT